MDVKTRITYDVLVTIIFIFVAGMLLFPSNMYMPLDRRISCLLGAAVCGVIAYCFYDSINPLKFVDVDVLLVLSAIMGINFLLLRHPWTTWAVERVQWYIRNDVDRAFYIVSVLSFFISQVIMNDGLCLMIVHPVLDAFKKKRRNSIDGHEDVHYNPAYHVHDPFYFMLNIACSANIGSVMTFAGNPQNLIIAQYLGTYMNCAVYYLYMLLPAVVTWGLTIGYINYCRKTAIKQLEQAKESHSLELVTITGKFNDSHNDIEKNDDEATHNPVQPTLPTETKQRKKITLHQEISMIQDQELASDDDRNRTDTQSKNEGDNTESEQDTNNHKKQTLSSLAVYSVVVEKEDSPVSPRMSMQYMRERLSSLNLEGKHLIFPILMLALIVLELVGIIPLTGLFVVMSISMIVSVLLYDYYLADLSTPKLVTDKILFITEYIEALFHSLDYNLLIIFTGLFIVSGSFLATGIPSFFWDVMAGSSAFKNAWSIVVISIYIIVFSQLVGNVPLVYLAKEEVQDLDRTPQIFGWLILAYVSTIAGNFTLVGSAANIIVVEKAMRHEECPVKIRAWDHFKICGLVTLVSITFGTLIISLEMILFM